MSDALHILDHVIIHLYEAHENGHITEATWIGCVRIIERAYFLCGGHLHSQIDSIHAKRNEILQSQVERASQDKFNFYPPL